MRGRFWRGSVGSAPPSAYSHMGKSRRVGRVQSQSNTMRVSRRCWRGLQGDVKASYHLGGTVLWILCGSGGQFPGKHLEPGGAVAHPAQLSTTEICMRGQPGQKSSGE